MKSSLIRKIKNREAKIGVIGMGYVGLPLVIRFCEEKFSVIGFDIDSDKVKKLNRGCSYIKHISSERIKEQIGLKRLEATDDFNRLSETDCILICVPTPLTKKKEPNLTYVENTAVQVSQHLRKGQLVSLESTTYPGTTQELLLPKLNENGIKVGKDYFLIFSPEREDPGNGRFSIKTIPKVVGGMTPECGEIGKILYEQIVDKVILVSSTQVAELSKLLENIFRSVNIALVNELKMLCDRMGINVWEVIEASSSKPFGFMPFYPGPGLGGHCIPIDPYYLTWKARDYNFTTKFIHLSGEINTSIPHYVVFKIVDTLNNKRKSLKGSKVLILGVAYKKDVDDPRESPALAIMRILKSKGAEFLYNDPYIPQIRKMRDYDFDMHSVDLTRDLLQSVDVVIIITNHSSYNYHWIVQNAKLVVDTRNATRDVLKNREKIILA